jgi:hypothetical protein
MNTQSPGAPQPEQQRDQPPQVESDRRSNDAPPATETRRSVLSFGRRAGRWVGAIVAVVVLVGAGFVVGVLSRSNHTSPPATAPTAPTLSDLRGIALSRADVPVDWVEDTDAERSAQQQSDSNPMSSTEGNCHDALTLFTAAEKSQLSTATTFEDDAISVATTLTYDTVENAKARIAAMRAVLVKCPSVQRGSNTERFSYVEDPETIGDDTLVYQFTLTSPSNITVPNILPPNLIVHDTVFVSRAGGETWEWDYTFPDGAPSNSDVQAIMTTAFGKWRRAIHFGS